MVIFGAQDASGASFFDGICDVLCTYTFFYSKNCNIKNYQKITNPKSEIQNPKFRKFGAARASCKGMLHNDPKSKIKNPRNPAEKVWILDFGLGDIGFGILDFGFWIPDFEFWAGPGDVPLGNSVTVP